MFLNEQSKVCSIASNKERELLGDSDCQLWFKQFPLEVRNNSVPRCIHQQGAIRNHGFCELRAKANRPTSVFMNLKLHSYYNHPNQSNYAKVISDPEKLLFICDETLGHKMNVVRLGGWFDFIDAECR